MRRASSRRSLRRRARWVPRYRGGEGPPCSRDGTLRGGERDRVAAAARRAARDLIDAGADGAGQLGHGRRPRSRARRPEPSACRDEVIAPDGTRFATARALARAAGCVDRRRHGRWPAAALLTSAHADRRPWPAKVPRYRATGAVAVDMESAAVAQVAATPRPALHRGARHRRHRRRRRSSSRRSRRAARARCGSGG